MIRHIYSDVGQTEAPVRMTNYEESSPCSFELLYRHHRGNDGGDQDVPWNAKRDVVGKGQAKR